MALTLLCSSRAGASCEDGKNTAAKAAAQAAAAGGGSGGGFTMEEDALHTTKSDCSVVVSAELLNVTTILSEDPGGDAAIMIFAGKDATQELNIIHPLYVMPKYAPDAVNMQLILV